MSDYLCEELIVEIFTRLPSKSLLRFRSLSKSLCSCISSPSFIRMHTFRSTQKILFIHQIEEPRTYFHTLHGEDELPLCLCPKRGYIGKITTFPRYPWGRYSETVGSCNGIMCLRNKGGFSLWNPSIRRTISVPGCPWESKLPWGGIGFGFESVSDDYKIVWMSYARDSSFVYALKTGTWCEIGSPKPKLSYVKFEAFLHNGVLHWEVHYFKIKPQDIHVPPNILTFDLSTHAFGVIPLPGYPWQWITQSLTTIQGRLALISYRTNVDDNGVVDNPILVRRDPSWVADTWILVRRDTSWSVVFKLGTGELPITEALQPQPNNNGDLLLNTYGEGLQVYNPMTGVRSIVVNFNSTSRLLGFQWYVETLQLLDMGQTA